VRVAESGENTYPPAPCRRGTPRGWGDSRTEPWAPSGRSRPAGRRCGPSWPA